MKNKIGLIVIFITIVVFFGIFSLLKNINSTSDVNIFTLPFTPSQRACTMEAKICPDGSAVGRTGPNCEFSLCPDKK
jgi:hypothetical protein